jgi:hypothetical protein
MSPSTFRPFYASYLTVNTSRLGRYFRTHKRLATTAFLITAPWAGIFGWQCSAFTRGRIVARCDLIRGHNEVLTLGLPPGWLPECARLLRERYGIMMRPIAGCAVSDTLIDYADGYNTVSVTSANRKFGRDVLRECTSEARRVWTARQPGRGGGFR